MVMPLLSTSQPSSTSSTAPFFLQPKHVTASTLPTSPLYLMFPSPQRRSGCRGHCCRDSIQVVVSSSMGRTLESLTCVRGCVREQRRRVHQVVDDGAGEVSKPYPFPLHLQIGNTNCAIYRPSKHKQSSKQQLTGHASQPA